MYNTKIDTIFTNSGNSKTSDPRRLLLNLKEKINILLYQFLAFTIHRKYKKVI